MTTPNQDDMLDRVRKLLAKAEAEGVTPHEAEALSGKAAELMARYGIERARLGALHPETDKSADMIVEIEDPYATTKALLLSNLAGAMGGQAIRLSSKGTTKIHVFGYQSDLDRIEMLYTSLLVQMHRAMTWQQRAISAYDRNHIRAWRRSFMIGYTSGVVLKVKAAEDAARNNAAAEDTPGGMSTALVLADRSLVVKTRIQQAYPRMRTNKISYSGNGYAKGYREGQRADIGGAKVGRGTRGTLGR
jgi:hypothetical protein